MSPLTPAAASISQKKRRLFSREDQVRKVKDRLSAPRFQMMILLALTGGAGFLTSWGLLRGGMDSMALRYPIAVGAGYLVFFLLLRIWIELHRDPLDHIVDVVDGCGELPELIVPSGHSSSSSGDFDLPDFGVGDGEALVFLVVVAIVAVLGLGVVIYALYLAPLLLAEVLVDGVLLVGLYKRLNRPQPTYWAFGAIKRTWVAAAIVAVTFFFAGAYFEKAAPEARSIGGVWKAVSSESQ
ncbi:MAG TPA: hypothetical protein VFR31_18140 [Thermoanaerobaculia bacterium]|nr:hypothetical protein [Thermoanaerobaculia bacterium]